MSLLELCSHLTIIVNSSFYECGLGTVAGGLKYSGQLVLIGTINVQKTTIVPFTKKWVLSGLKPLVLGNAEISLVRTTKYLGVTFEQRLTANQCTKNSTHNATIVLVNCEECMENIWVWTLKLFHAYTKMWKGPQRSVTVNQNFVVRYNRSIKNHLITTMLGCYKGHAYNSNCSSWGHLKPYISEYTSTGKRQVCHLKSNGGTTPKELCLWHRSPKVTSIGKQWWKSRNANYYRAEKSENRNLPCSLKWCGTRMVLKPKGESAPVSIGLSRQH